MQKANYFASCLQKASNFKVPVSLADWCRNLQEAMLDLKDQIFTPNALIGSGSLLQTLT
jgi:hypothetical protein